MLPKRTPTQREADLVFAENMSLKGHTVRQIAEAINAQRPYAISHSQVVYDLKKLQARWKAENLATVDQHVHRTLESLRRQEQEAWQAWEKSKADHIRKAAEQSTSEDGVGEGGKRERKSVVQEGQCGDVSYQRLILDIHGMRAKLLGLNAPERTQVDLQGAGQSTVFLIPANGREDPATRPPDLPPDAQDTSTQ